MGISPLKMRAMCWFCNREIFNHKVLQVAECIDSHHHTVTFTYEDIKNSLEKVIWHTETSDITTIRASIPMFLLCKYVKEQTAIRVLLSGEISDELFGYKYTDYAPDAAEFQQEAQKRIKELYMYDVLRADRCIAGNGIEARVPFSDKALVAYVMNIDPVLKLNTYDIGKYLLRKAFEGTNLLPNEILYRDKVAFSDAVGHGMVDYLQQMAEDLYSDEEFLAKQATYTYHQPPSKEALMYREL